MTFEWGKCKTLKIEGKTSEDEENVQFSCSNFMFFRWNCTSKSEFVFCFFVEIALVRVNLCFILFNWMMCVFRYSILPSNFMPNIWGLVFWVSLCFFFSIIYDYMLFFYSTHYYDFMSNFLGFNSWIKFFFSFQFLDFFETPWSIKSFINFWNWPMKWERRQRRRKKSTKAIKEKKKSTRNRKSSSKATNENNSRLSLCCSLEPIFMMLWLFLFEFFVEIRDCYCCFWVLSLCNSFISNFWGFSLDILIIFTFFSVFVFGSGINIQIIWSSLIML